MKDYKLHLFIIKNLVAKKDSIRIQRAFMDILYAEDFSYMATLNKKDRDMMVCSFELDKIKILEKFFSDNNLLIKSEDISDPTLKFNYCEELELIMNDNHDNKFIVERFIVRNLDLDSVLDKICDNGMESLNRLERKFLSRLN